MRARNALSSWLACGLAFLFASALRAADADPVRAKLDKAWAAYNASLGKFQETVASHFDKREEAARAKGDSAAVKQIKAERQAFEAKSELPASAPATVKVQLNAARTALELAYKTAIREYTKASRDEQAAIVETELAEFLKGGQTTPPPWFDFSQQPKDADTAKAAQTAWAKHLGVPATTTLNLPGGGAKIPLVLIPPGTFLMGSPASEAGRWNEETQHHVTVTQAYYMAATELSVGQFAAFVSLTKHQTDAEKLGSADVIFGGQGAGHSWRKVGFPQTDAHPVVNVSWNDAKAFCAWASKASGKSVRLATEAEWEYACRAGTTTVFPWGGDPDAGKGHAIAMDATTRRQFPKMPQGFAWDDGFAYTAPVGSAKPNAWGLHDMIGNAWEWCDDRFSDYPNGSATDPKGPASGRARILRGGAWTDGPRHTRSARRGRSDAEGRCDNVGFRVVVGLGE